MVSPEVRRVMEAYARGVNLYVEQHATRLPIEFTLLNYKPRRLAANRLAGDCLLHVPDVDGYPRERDWIGRS